jgi:formate dehydrogenase assembly factor FdhD
MNFAQEISKTDFTRKNNPQQNSTRNIEKDSEKLPGSSIETMSKHNCKDRQLFGGNCCGRVAGASAEKNSRKHARIEKETQKQIKKQKVYQNVH